MIDLYELYIVIRITQVLTVLIIVYWIFSHEYIIVKTLIYDDKLVEDEDQ